MASDSIYIVMLQGKNFNGSRKSQMFSSLKLCDCISTAIQLRTREVYYTLTLTVARLVTSFKSTITSGKVLSLNTPAKKKGTMSDFMSATQ